MLTTFQGGRLSLHGTTHHATMPRFISLHLSRLTVCFRMFYTIGNFAINIHLSTWAACFLKCQLCPVLLVFSRHNLWTPPLFFTKCLDTLRRRFDFPCVYPPSSQPDLSLVYLHCWYSNITTWFFLPLSLKWVMIETLPPSPEPMHNMLQLVPFGATKLIFE